MADHLTKVCHSFFDGNLSVNDLLHRFRGDDSMKLGLEQFNLILNHAILSYEAERSKNENCRCRWLSNSAVQSIVSLGYKIVLASRSLAVEELAPVVVAVLPKLLQFCVCYLEKNELNYDNLRTQSNIMLLLELAMVGGSDESFDDQQASSKNVVPQLFLSISSCDHVAESSSYMKCSCEEGIKCFKIDKALHPLLMTISHESPSSGGQAFGLCGPSLDTKKIIFSFTYWAVTHLDFVRLVHYFRMLISLPVKFHQKVDGQNIHQRVLFGLRTLKLLKNIFKDFVYSKCDVSLLQEFALCADLLPRYFRLCVEFSSGLSCADGKPENVIFLMLEEFLHLVHCVFLNVDSFQNIQIFMAASILDNLDSHSSAWRLDESAPHFKLTLVYTTRVVFFVLKLIRNLRRHACQVLDLDAFEKYVAGDPNVILNDSPCNVHFEKVPSFKMLTFDEQLKIIFTPSSQWLDILMHLIFFLNSEGVKLRQKVNRSHSGSLNDICSLEIGDQFCHEDEVLFGNLFSKSGSMGPSNVCDGPIDLSTPSIPSNFPLQAVAEILGFFKDCVFSIEWSSFLFECSRLKLRENHIDILLSVLTSWDTKSCVGCAPVAVEIKNVHICFELLRVLLTNHAICGSIQMYLINHLLKIEGGSFMCNDQTLTLIADTLLSRAGKDGIYLRTKVFRVFACLIVEKSKDCLKLSSMKEFIGTLPSSSYLEVLLLAFHLSSQGEKATQAGLVVSSLLEIDTSLVGFSSQQISCLGLLVSRLILLLRHMMLYASACPFSLRTHSWLKFKEASTCAYVLYHPENNYSLSWVSAVAQQFLGAYFEEDPLISKLIGQLIDIVPLPLHCRDESAIKFLSLNWDDICHLLSKILEFWEGKMAESVEDLIVERYVFFLCYDIFAISSAPESQISWWSKLGAPEISNMVYFFPFSHLLIGECNDIHKSYDIPVSVFNVLCSLHAVDIPEDIGYLGWDFLRNGSWLNLVIYFFDAGICRHSTRKKESADDPVCAKHILVDDWVVDVAEGLISYLIESDQVSLLLKMLSSMLNRYLTTYQKAFLAILENVQQNTHKFSALLLLKHLNFDWCLRDELLNKSGACCYNLESAMNIISKLRTAIDEPVLISHSKVLYESMLHGFPFNIRVSGAVLLSCVVSIRGLVAVLSGLFEHEDLKEFICNEVEIFHEILDSVVAIKLDRILQCLWGSCEAIVSHMHVGFVVPKDIDFFVMKHIKEFLSEISVGEVSNGISEWVITKIIDSVDGLRRHTEERALLKFYLGADSLPGTMNFYGLPYNDLLLLIDSLNWCLTESINKKVLNFFISLLSDEAHLDVKLKVQEKFLGMELHHLSEWLEKHLLGSLENTSSDVDHRNSDETTVSFLLSLLSPPKSHMLHDHLFEALLAVLETSFLSYDINIAKLYFSFVIEFCDERHSLKLFLKRSVKLMEKLASEERFLPGLGFLMGFLVNVLADCESHKNIQGKIAWKYSFGQNPPAGSITPKPVGLGKCSNALTSENEVGHVALECDAMSVDEDEDDETSNDEISSIGKCDEGEPINESVLPSRICTFTSSGSNFMEQHWYFCYTCDLTASKGCCSTCAKVCHHGHRVVYSRLSRFFCDCGAGGVKGSSCQCLKPQNFIDSESGPSPAANFQSLVSFDDEKDQSSRSDSDIDDSSLTVDFDISSSLSFPKDLRGEILSLLEEIDFEGWVVRICSSLLPSIARKRGSGHSKNEKMALGNDKVVSYNVELLQLKRAYKSGSLDLKTKGDHAHSKEVGLRLACGTVVKSLLSLSNRGRLAVGDGDKVAIFDIMQLVGQASAPLVMSEKINNIKPLSKNVVGFDVVHVAFNLLAENHLAVAGYEDCHVLVLNHRGEVTDRVAIELAIQGTSIKSIDWIPGCQVKLMVVTDRFIKIYDLSQDNISPLHYFTLPGEMIADATLCVASHGRLFLFVFSVHGRIFKLELSTEIKVGTTPLSETIYIHDREINAKGSALQFAPASKLIFLSYEDGTCLIGRLNPDASSLTNVSFLYEEVDNKRVSAGLHHWKELQGGSGLFLCLSSLKGDAALVISTDVDGVNAQIIGHPRSSVSSVVGFSVYKPFSKDMVYCLFLHEDCSLHIYANCHKEDDDIHSVVERVKKLGSGILNDKAHDGMKPDFPLDFFEKTVCITANVKLGGQAIKIDSEGAKHRLASEDGFLESPSLEGFQICISNSNADIVMVGLRIHVGYSSVNHIPTEVTVFQRVVKLDKGMRSWYDVPFTVAESLLSDEEFVIFVGPAFNGTALPRIDSLEVYGQTKDDFGWKEKMDRMLDMEDRACGSSPLFSGSGKKCLHVPPTLIPEFVVSLGLKFLFLFYLLRICQDNDDVEVELCEPKCKLLLQEIFEIDRGSLQVAASSVLHALYPKKERYYQIKDNFHLLGVTKCAAELSSALGAGCSAGKRVVEEFIAQIRFVSRIALQRQSNLVIFLEKNGHEVMDQIDQVLWGILDVEQLDAHTLNKLVISYVELVYHYAECLVLSRKELEGSTVMHAVLFLKKLLFSSNEAVQTSSSLAISSIFLQVPSSKQSIVGKDDLAHTVSTSAIAEATSGNSQHIIEEESILSSVQYCCDGCSTVPILRRRWHCTVCPDFDLCESCYQVMNARVSAPHSKEHPMMSIPIEVDPLGDDNEICLITEGNGSSSQNMPPSTSVLEHSLAGAFSSFEIDAISISSSNRAANSYLLAELLQQLKGWMVVSSGVRAIPIMQLFYRLSSAAHGPFVDSCKPESLDLEKLVRWLLGEIELNKPFAVQTRSYFGEVAILVFMFFTLMLQNWHQPVSDLPVPQSGGADKKVGEGSSISSQEKNELPVQMLRAWNLIMKQDFVNYLMDILQQLAHVFKSATVTSETFFCSSNGYGALLTTRRDFPAGYFFPFFSDSYARTHHKDIFMDYHRLLLENVFRLIYTVVRPEKQDKMGEKGKACRTLSCKDIKLDGCQDLLCRYINNPQTTFIRRYARKLFLHLCGSKSYYYSVRDSWQFSNEMNRLSKHMSKSDGPQDHISYDTGVKITTCLSMMVETASRRPRNWQKYCLTHGDVVPLLLKNTFSFGEDSIILALKLMGLAFYLGRDISQSLERAEAAEMGMPSLRKSGLQSQDLEKNKSESGSESGMEKAYLGMESAVDILIKSDDDVLRKFIDYFLLGWNSRSVRMEAKWVVHGAWHHGSLSVKEALLLALLQKVKSLPVYGQNIVELTELLHLLLGKAPENYSRQQSVNLMNRCLNPDAISSVFETFRSQNELIANHPNSQIYNALSCLVEFDGYFLESVPCVACSSPEVRYSKIKLESLKSETKFTDNRIIVRCTGSYTIHTVIMNVHEARKSKSIKMLNLYYNNRPAMDLLELKKNWSLWKHAKSCHLVSNQAELKVELPIPITACNLMIELDSFYENLQALSLEQLQCPRCSRAVTDKHGICSNCHENAYQCRQCRNINYETLDSFLCNECGYSKYGRFDFYFMAKPSFRFDTLKNDEDMKRCVAAIEAESENAHRRYQQLLGFKKPLVRIISSIGDNEMDLPQKDLIQQMMIPLPGPSCKINRKIALLGVLYADKCKASFDSVTKSFQTLQGLRKVLMSYVHQKHSQIDFSTSTRPVSSAPYSCYGCATTFVTQCLGLLQVLSKHCNAKKQLFEAGILLELFGNNIHQGPKPDRAKARAVLCAFSEGDVTAVSELNSLIERKVIYCLEHHRSMDITVAIREELLLLSEMCTLADEFWELRLRLVFQLLFSSINFGVKHPAIAEHIILPCLRIVSQACAPPKLNADGKDKGAGKFSSAEHLGNEKIQLGSLVGAVGESNYGSELKDSEMKLPSPSRVQEDVQLLSYSEWTKGASYLDFVRRKCKISQVVVSGYQRPLLLKQEYIVIKCALRWKQLACKRAKGGGIFEVGSWVEKLVFSACSHCVRSEMCMLIGILCAQSSSRRCHLLQLVVRLLPATLSTGDRAAEYFELFFKLIESEDARLFLTAGGCVRTICKLITQEIANVKSLEISMHFDISQGFILNKLIKLLNRFLEVATIRSRFMQDNLLPDILEALIVIHGLVVQKTKLINDCDHLLRDILDGLLIESNDNKRQFIKACISALGIQRNKQNRQISLFILEQLCNLICPSKPNPVYLLILNKVQSQEEFIRGSMNKNPYSSSEIGPLMRDVKNKICHHLDMLGLLDDDNSMELLVSGNIISLELSIAQVYEQVWKKSRNQSTDATGNSVLSSVSSLVTNRLPMIVTYRLQGLDGEATEPMIKELEEDKEEAQDPEIEVAIAGAIRECGGLEIILGMIQRLLNDLKSNQEQLGSVLNLLMHCCKIRENRCLLLKLGALDLLLETAKCAFTLDSLEPADGILLIVEILTVEANESADINVTLGSPSVTSDDTAAREQAKKMIHIFLERLCQPSGPRKFNKQQFNTETVARILPYFTYGEPGAMNVIVQYFFPYLQNWREFDEPRQQNAPDHRCAVENFVRVLESLKASSFGEQLKDIILQRGIPAIAVGHLRESFGYAEQDEFKSRAELSSSLDLPSIPLILSLLRGLSIGHLHTQQCIDEGGILPLLHLLEGVSGENEIGVRAENLLDILSDKEGKGDGFLREKVAVLRDATRDEMRRRALRKREQLLQGLGMHQEVALDGAERIIVNQPALEGLEDVEEEKDGPSCMVCREGYSLRSMDLMGVYSYSKRVNLGAVSSGSMHAEFVYTTVSCFNIIHFQCHQEAKRADAALKNPKKEWEGATLRNNESLCNSLFPVRGPSVPLAQYVRFVDQYWSNLNALGRADGSRLRLLTYDIVLMLARFATGASFSAESRGGGRESNSKFLPFMIQMAFHLLEQASPTQCQSMSDSVATYITSSPTDIKAATKETVQFMMVNSLLSQPFESWLQQRCAFIQRGIYHAHLQHMQRKPPGEAPQLGPNELMSISRPMLIYVGMMEQLQRFFKVRKSPPHPEGEKEGSGDGSWKAVMKQRLLNVRDMLGLSKQLLSWLERMNFASTLQETFDVMGVLTDVLSGSSSCQDFIISAFSLNET